MKRLKVKVKEKPKVSRADYVAFMNECDCTVNIRERNTEKDGIACHNSNPNLISVFYGAEDGSEDCVITKEEFNKRFIIVSVEFHTWAVQHDDWVKPEKDFGVYVNFNNKGE